MALNKQVDVNVLTDEILKKIVEREEFRVDLFKEDESNFRKRVEMILRLVLKENKLSLGRDKYDEILREVMAYFLGLGPLEKLLGDRSISEIMVNGYKQVYIERSGNLELTDINFKDEQHLLYVISKIISPLGRRVSEFEPYVDARLQDGSRVNIVRAPVSGIGPVITIRKFSHHIFQLKDLIEIKTLDEASAEFLRACIISRLNILVSGGASSGKTTLLNALASFIPDNERVVTIEDTRELHLERAHTIPLETRLSNIEGKGEITIRDLVRNALHMRPDRIIVGEVRFDEVLDMVQAMNTGHEGSMTTLHANSSIEAMDRLEVLSLLGNPNMSSEVARRQIINAIDIVIQMARLPNGSRKVIQVSEVVKTKEYQLEDIIINNDEQGQDQGFKFTGKIPRFYRRLKNKSNYYYKDFEGEK